MGYEVLSDKKAIVIDGKEFRLVKKGADYARQFGNLTSWLGTHALAGLMQASEAGVLDVDDATGQGTAISLISFLMSESITPEAMVELSAILIGSDYEFAEEHFDPGWLVEAGIMVLTEQDGIVKAIRRVWDQFFLVSEQVEVDAEGQARDS